MVPQAVEFLGRQLKHEIAWEPRRIALHAPHKNLGLNAVESCEIVRFEITDCDLKRRRAGGSLRPIAHDGCGGGLDGCAAKPAGDVAGSRLVGGGFNIRHAGEEDRADRAGKKRTHTRPSAAEPVWWRSAFSLAGRLWPGRPVPAALKGLPYFLRSGGLSVSLIVPSFSSSRSTPMTRSSGSGSNSADRKSRISRAVFF